MPNKGQKVLTIKETTFKRLKDSWEKNRPELVSRRKATTLTGYAQSLILRALEAEEAEGRFEIINRFENHALVRDYFLVKDADVEIRMEGDYYGTVYCNLDRTGKCPHVGIVLSDPETVKAANNIGIRLRRAPRSHPIEEATRVFGMVEKESDDGEVSEEKFLDLAEGEGYGDAEGREMLRDLCMLWDIRVTRKVRGTYCFRAVS